MERYIPEIQDELRRRGFPGFRQGIVEEVTWNFTTESNIKPAIETLNRPRWEFFNSDATWRVILTPDALTLATSAYVRYEEPFESHLRTALAVLDARANLQIVTRLGLRYVDLVAPSGHESFEEYLHPSLLGVPPNEIGLRDAVPFIQIKGRTDSGFMVMRCVYTNTGQYVPPDLADLDLRMKRQIPAGRELAILDFDHFALVQTPFELEKTLERLALLHDTLDVAFRTSVTPIALERWGAASLEAKPAKKTKGRAR